MIGNIKFLFTHNIIFFCFVFAYLGSIFGSFINMLVYRLPNNISIIKPPSHCPVCNHNLKWYNNIPIFSYIFQRGRCSFCHTKIPVRYLLIEIMTSILFVLLFLWYIKFSFYYNLYDLILFYLLLVISITIFIVDAKHKVIPMLMVYVGFVGAIALSFFTNSTNIKYSIIGGVVGFLILGAIRLVANKIYKKEAMGDGDPYVLAMLGLFCGFESILFILIISSFLGALIGSIYYAIKRDTQIPFGPFLVLAGWIYIIIKPFGGVSAINNFIYSIHKFI